MHVKTGNILIVDDNKNILETLSILLKPRYKNIKTATDPKRIPTLLKESSWDLVLLDMNYQLGKKQGAEGFYWLDKILSINPNQIVILITAFGDIDMAVKAIKKGATDFILKPWNNQKLYTTINTALTLSYSKSEISNLKAKQQELWENTLNDDIEIIGESDCIKDLLDQVHKVAKTDANVLILGENGTGKDLIAKKIHSLSGRNNSAFINVDLGSLSENLFESELYGHVKGAFTDAKKTRLGRFDIASGGTIFLNEIANISLNHQAKLLSVLENREITPVGDNSPKPVDIRVISASNKDIKELVQKDVFREDLFYRINTFTIKIPSLRERSDDIALLAHYFTKRFALKYEKPFIKLNGKAIAKLMQYKWPGNVRELQHTIEKAVILAENDFISPNEIILELGKEESLNHNIPLNLEELEVIAIKRALKKHYGNVSDASKDLGISRQTLYRKIDRYGI